MAGTTPPAASPRRTRDTPAQPLPVSEEEEESEAEVPPSPELRPARRHVPAADQTAQIPAAIPRVSGAGLDRLASDQHSPAVRDLRLPPGALPSSSRTSWDRRRG